MDICGFLCCSWSTTFRQGLSPNQKLHVSEAGQPESILDLPISASPHTCRPNHICFFMRVLGILTQASCLRSKHFYPMSYLLCTLTTIFSIPHLPAQFDSHIVKVPSELRSKAWNSNTSTQTRVPNLWMETPLGFERLFHMGHLRLQESTVIYSITVVIL